MIGPAGMPLPRLERIRGLGESQMIGFGSYRELHQIVWRHRAQASRRVEDGLAATVIPQSHAALDPLAWSLCSLSAARRRREHYRNSPVVALHVFRRLWRDHRASCASSRRWCGAGVWCVGFLPAAPHSRRAPTPYPAASPSPSPPGWQRPLLAPARRCWDRHRRHGGWR